MNILSKAKAKEFKSLSNKKVRDELSLFIAEGEKCVMDSLNAFELEYLISTEKWIESNKEIKEQYAEQLLLTDKRGIEIVSSLSSLPEVIAVFRKPLNDGKLPKLEKDQLYLLLDEIQDPGNLGTIIRTCDWFGVYDIFASKTTADVYGPKVVQATMGSLSRVRVHYLDLKELISKNREIKVIGTLMEGRPLSEFKEGTKGFLLMGNEGKGVSTELKKMIDISLTIPPVNKESHPDSLNVAIATAIILSHFK